MKDIICVTNSTRSMYSCMEMRMVFNNTLEEDISMKALGLNRKGNKLQNTTAFGGIGDVINILGIRVPPFMKSEPEWVDIYCNDCHQQQLKAYMNKKGEIVYMESNHNNKYKLYLNPTSSMLSSMNLTMGCNNIIFKHRLTGISISCDIWLYDCEDTIVIMDIDGTVTKSDVRGYIETVFLNYYSYVHSGLASFLTDIDKQGLKIIFLTSRPIAHYKESRNLLNGVKQDIYSIPRGPIMLNNEKLFDAAYRELISRATVEFKSGVLLSIVGLFKTAGRVSQQNPFIMGFGNKSTDADAYLLAGVPNSSILIINPDSKIKIWQDFKDKSFNSYDDDSILNYVKEVVQSYEDVLHA